MSSKITLFFSLVSLLNGSYYKDLVKASIEAKNTNKNIIYFIVSSDCFWCKKYFTDITEDKKLQEFLSKNYVIVLKNVAIGDRIDKIIPYFGTTPTTIILSSNGYVVTYFEGAINMKDLEILLGMEDEK
jgi:uncharacterized protein YyaL (SSP411 family)